MFSDISLIFSTAWKIIFGWGWIFIPFILWKPAFYLWLWWRRELFWGKQKSILLEIKLPKESLKPIRAMEQVLAGLWQGFWDPPRPWEKLWDGKTSLGFQIEITSIEGITHFYIRCPDYRKDVVEANIYSQYPEAEVSLAEDYTKNIPHNIPNKDWDVWGSDYCFIKPNPYPIKTYRQFETESEKEEEKRVDPIASLFECLAKLKKGEQAWIQLQASSLAQEAVDPFLKQGEAIKDKLAKRTNEIKAQKPMAQEAAEILITGRVPEEKKEEKFELIAPELRLTPGEREIIEEVEKKISKPVFECSMRFLFLGQRELWFKPNLRLFLAHFGNYVTQNLNSLVPLGRTISKVYSKPPLSILDERRLYLRKRKIFRLYLDRFPPYFPLSATYNTGVFILNIEELASLFHFPSRRVAPAPGISRVEAKKGEAPSELPVE